MTNHVIVTVPIGYLQKHYASLFTPSLPERKIQAIENVGFSSLLKLFVIWDKPFWKESFSGVQFVWTTSSLPEDLRSKIGEAESPESTKVYTHMPIT
jgi:monoamine oxidase